MKAAVCYIVLLLLSDWDSEANVCAARSTCRDSDAAVIPGGLTPLIQTLFGKILPHPNFAVAITNSLTQYCNRSRGY